MATGRSGSACACVFRTVLLVCVWFLGAVLVSACAWGLRLALVRATALPMFGETLSLGEFNLNNITKESFKTKTIMGGFVILFFRGILIPCLW